MPRETAQINDLLKWGPEMPHVDPVPPWLLVSLDRAILRELALISLERQRDIQQINLNTINKAINTIRGVRQ